MIDNDRTEATQRARQTLALLPVLRRWVTARVHWAGVEVGLSLRQYAALHSIRQGASSPEQFAKLQADSGLARNAVEETLRHWGPVDFVGRRFATQSLGIAGTPIAAGDQVTVSLAAANRDPGRFADPDAFDISREDANRHVTFGKGIHICLGAPLARVKGQIAFEKLIRRCPNLRLAVPADQIQLGGSFLRGFRQVPLLF
jgi:cytochrome P450 family 107 subfamily K polypeptide 1